MVAVFAKSMLHLYHQISPDEISFVGGFTSFNLIPSFNIQQQVIRSQTHFPDGIKNKNNKNKATNHP